MLVAGISTLIFNGNPLLCHDAYYILADLTELPDLGALGALLGLSRRAVLPARPRYRVAGRTRRAGLVRLLRRRLTL